MKENIKKEISVPEGVTVSYVNEVMTIKGSQGEVSKNIGYPTISVIVEGSDITIACEKSTKREKRMIGTFTSHINNMVKGVQSKFIYKLKICSGHFPMNSSVSGQKFVVKNFLGEKHPRVNEFPSSVSVKITGQEVEVTSCSKEDAGQTAGSIERLCRINNRDLRIFQDGIYIIKKGNKVI